MAFTQGNLRCWEFFDAFNANLSQLELGSADDPMNKTLLTGALRGDIVDEMRRELKGARIDQLSYDEIQRRAKDAEDRLRATDSLSDQPGQSLAYESRDRLVRKAWAKAYNRCNICLKPMNQGGHGRLGKCGHKKIPPRIFNHLRQEYSATGTIRPSQSGNIDDVMTADLQGETPRLDRSFQQSNDSKPGKNWRGKRR